VIHVGRHKTGSTYLQYRFRAARAALSDRGIHYQACWETPHRFGHTLLAAALRAGEVKGLAAPFAALIASGADIVLISAEDLCNLGKEGFAHLRALAGHGRADIVYIFRRWSGLIPSARREGIKHGNTASLPQFLLPHMMRPTASRLLNLDLRLAPMVEVFGRDHVHLVGYDRLRDQRIDLFDHFARSFLGWPDPPSDVGRTMNASMNAVDTELIRVLNALHQQQGGGRSAELRVRLAAAGAGLDLAVPRAAMAAHVTKLRFRDNGPTLRALQAELAAKYLALMVPPGLNGQLFTPRVEEFAYVAPDYLLAPGVVPALQAARNRLFPDEGPTGSRPGD
jgi:hypothetical protein